MTPLPWATWMTVFWLVVKKSFSTPALVGGYFFISSDKSVLRMLSLSGSDEVGFVVMTPKSMILSSPFGVFSMKP